MSGVVLDINLSDLDLAADRLARLEGRLPVSELVDTATALIESQTRRRIKNEKKTPDGTPWANWSPAYAKTRRGGHSLLRDTNSMVDSIFGEARGEQGVVGTNDIRAALHNFGGEFKAWGKHDAQMPQREFIGLSQDNLSELSEVLNIKLAKIEARL